MNTTFKTIDWLNKEIDSINAKATMIGEMLLEETNIELIAILDKKLEELEKSMNHIALKIEFEKRNCNV